MAKQQMKPEAQRIAIAEACIKDFSCCRCGEQAALMRYHAPFCSDDCAERAGDYALDDGEQAIPDYLNDLNAMHEAEKGLTIAQWHNYCDELEQVTGGTKVRICATAAQRAEAFLRTIGKWKP